MAKIVVIDDDKEMRSLVEDHLKSQAYEVHGFHSPVVALEKILSDEVTPDLIVTDLQMPDMNGIEVIRRAKAHHPEVPVIVMTAFGSIESAVDAMRKGAFDYLTKPFKLSELNIVVTRALEMGRLSKENVLLRAEVKKGFSKGLITGKSKPMRDLVTLIERIAPANSSVLITGESGTGKEVVARTLHQMSSRAEKPFVAINCTAIPETLLESELFGHIKGSFTGADKRKFGLFEEAQGGTLFLDEIGDMDLSLQAKLLRVLQERKIRPVGETKDIDVDVRVVAATHKDIKKAIREGLFREDLFYRLNVIPVVIPPLRHRRDDIPLLAQTFLLKYAAINNSPARSFSPGALLLLVNRSWPGNVRELENLVERLVVLARASIISEDEIPLPENEDVDTFFASSAQSLITLEEMEKRYLQYVLTKTGGKKDKTAQILGINRRTLYRKEREYGWVTEELSPDGESLEHL